MLSNTMRVFVASTLVLVLNGGPGVSEVRAAEAGQVEKRGSLVRIAGGKTIHIRCSGTGSPSVILTTGMGGSTADWRKVQPHIAQITKVCAWDRLGSGLSSKSTGRETVAETTADLMATLKVARLEGPYILVGHSLGSYESLLFKDKSPKAVMGMVLVDPSIPDQVDRLNKAGHKRPAAAKELLSPLVISSKLVVDPKRHYGAMPIIVLTSTKGPALPPGADAEKLKAEFAPLTAEMHRGHAELAALSSRGVQRPVPDSGHYIQLDQPNAVIGAIKEVVLATRSKATK